jgi:hypothetical protein
MHERIEPYLESWNRFVLVEKEVTRGRNTVAGFGLVGARLPCPKILQGLGSVKDSVGVDVADGRADFRIRGHRTDGRAGKYKGKGDDEHEGADNQRSLHRYILLRGQSGNRDILEGTSVHACARLYRTVGPGFSDEDGEHDETEDLDRQSGACLMTR